MSRRTVILCIERFAFEWCFLILCQALVAQLTVHSVFSSGIELVQYDSSHFDRIKPEIFLRQHRAAFCFSNEEGTVAKGSACFRKFCLPYSRGAGLSFLCMLISRKRFLCIDRTNCKCCASWRDVYFTVKLLVPVMWQLRLCVCVCGCRMKRMEAPVQRPSLLLAMTQHHHPIFLS